MAARMFTDPAAISSTLPCGSRCRTTLWQTCRLLKKDVRKYEAMDSVDRANTTKLSALESEVRRRLQILHVMYDQSNSHR